MTPPVDSRSPEADRTAVERSALSRVERAVRRARLNLLWESIWPLVAPFFVLAAFFAAVSWLGLWRLTNTPVRYAILAAFAAAVLYLLWRLATGIIRPTRAAAFARVEQATGALHRPATSLADRLANKPNDPATEALWIAHRQRLLAALDRLRAGVPAPRLAARDPYAVRFLVALLFVVGFVTAGPERIARIGEAWQGGETAAATIARIDAWVTPPAYTGRAPIFLTGEAARPEGTLYSVPAGSVVTVRTGGGPDLDVLSVGIDGELPVPPAEATLGRALPGEPAPLERVVTLKTEGSVIVRKAGRDVAEWRFAVEPDSPPRIAFNGDPKITVSGALDLSYSVEDDYGVVAAFGKIEPVRELNQGEARPLYEAPALPLSLPQLRARSGSSQTVRDLTSHPWAGAKVTLTLVARDEAGQEGYSAPFEMTLPAHQFVDLLARSVIEQRTNLALDANAVPMVDEALDALTFAPDNTIENKGTYLALRSAYHRLALAETDDGLRDVVDYLWSIALGIEDGDLSLAAQDLQAAQDALREALENGASDEEIQRLTEQLRQAMDRFLQALVEQAQRNPQVSNLPQNMNQQTLRSQDLQQLLDQIQNLATTGARDAARQLLSQLQSMLENLQAGTPQMGGQQGDNQAMQQMMENLNQLGEMIQQQQELMNQTFRAQRGLNPSEQGDSQPMSREQLEQALRDLQQQQQGLQESLQGLMQEMEGMGMGENGQLGQAGQAMGEAAGNLGNGRAGQAVTNQSDALDALRQGAQGLVQQLAQGGQRGGDGQRGGGNDQQFAEEDPLGRPQRELGADLGSTVKVPDEIDTQRAREILDAIRQRLGELYRPELERDYLERLLNQF